MTNYLAVGGMREAVNWDLKPPNTRVEPELAGGAICKTSPGVPKHSPSFRRRHRSWTGLLSNVQRAHIRLPRVSRTLKKAACRLIAL